MAIARCHARDANADDDDDDAVGRCDTVGRRRYGDARHGGHRGQLLISISQLLLLLFLLCDVYFNKGFICAARDSRRFYFWAFPLLRFHLARGCSSVVFPVSIVVLCVSQCMCVYLCLAVNVCLSVCVRVCVCARQAISGALAAAGCLCAFELGQSNVFIFYFPNKTR